MFHRTFQGTFHDGYNGERIGKKVIDIIDNWKTSEIKEARGKYTLRIPYWNRSSQKLPSALRDKGIEVAFKRG